MPVSLPEFHDGGQQLIRIPAEVDVTVSARVRALLDTAPVQRLRHISQLGVVSLVYPGAVHSRFEHSLGVYRLACLVAKHLLASDETFAAQASEADLKLFILSGLLHDVGHWPFCHAIEDLRLPEFPTHERLARSIICNSPLAELIEQQWRLDPLAVADLIASTRGSQPAPTVLRSLLSGPVDIDKMDYLQRDSHHAGVPYGRNFDVLRLISSLCVGRDGRSIAVSQKGKTAAEMMVFARYVMFSEVYWHHAVRSATAMLQRMVFLLRDSLATEDWLLQTEAEFVARLLELSSSHAPAQQLARALFGHQRQLFKRVAQYTLSDHPEVFAAVARRPYEELVRCSERLAERLGPSLTQPLRPGDIIIDAPPVKLEVQFKVDIKQSSLLGGRDEFVPLSAASPVVRALATEQFDNFVKRVRIFVNPDRADELRGMAQQVTEHLLLVSANA